MTLVTAPPVPARTADVEGLVVRVRELENGVWHAIALPARAGWSVDGVGPVFATEWRARARFVVADARVVDEFRWVPEQTGLGRQPWMTTAARAALYEMLGRAAAAVGIASTELEDER